MKYNPNYHQNVVNNFRRGYKERYKQELSKLSDEQIWNIYEENFGVEVIGSEDPEEAIYVELEASNQAAK